MHTTYLFSILGWISNLGFLRKKHISEIKNLLVSHKWKIFTLESNGMIWDWSLKTYKWGKRINEKRIKGVPLYLKIT